MHLDRLRCRSVGKLSAAWFLANKSFKSNYNSEIRKLLIG